MSTIKSKDCIIIMIITDDTVDVGWSRQWKVSIIISPLLLLEFYLQNLLET